MKNTPIQLQDCSKAANAVAFDRPFLGMVNGTTVQVINRLLIVNGRVVAGEGEAGLMVIRTTRLYDAVEQRAERSALMAVLNRLRNVKCEWDNMNLRVNGTRIGWASDTSEAIFIHGRTDCAALPANMGYSMSPSNQV